MTIAARVAERRDSQAEAEQRAGVHGVCGVTAQPSTLANARFGFSAAHAKSNSDHPTQQDEYRDLVLAISIKVLAQ